MVKRMSEEEFERQFAEATAKGEERLCTEPLAESVRYDAASGRIQIDLSNNCTFIFPAERAQGLRGASAEELGEVEIVAGGLDLHWRRLDAQFAVAGLLAGIFGTKRWMAELGRSGDIESKTQPASASEEAERGSRPRAKKTA